MKRRYQVHRDYYAGIGEGNADWAVWDMHDGQRTADDQPIAVFARRSDARWFARVKNK